MTRSGRLSAVVSSVPQVNVNPAATRSFVRTHGRVLEVRLAEVLLDGAPARPVFQALEAYRNADGGFGHGLEPDLLAPDSQPLAADFAFAILDELTTHDPKLREPAADVARRTLDSLDSVAAPDGGLSIVLPSAAAYPRAAHWGKCDFPPGLNPTAAIVGRARLLGLDHPWLERATQYCQAAIQAPDAVEDAHTALCVFRFLDSLADSAQPDQREWAAKQQELLGQRLDRLPLFQPKPSEGYGLTPLHFAPAPDSLRRRLFTSDAIDAHLDVLADAHDDDGGWPLTWDPPGPGSALAWRAAISLRALMTLQAYGRT